MDTKTINISIPKKVLKEVDRKAKEEYRSRSELFREATLMYIRTKDNLKVLQDNLSRRAKKMGLKSEKDIENLIDSLRE